jgi:hypothetical protein
VSWFQHILTSHYGRDSEFAQALIGLSALASVAPELPSHIDDVEESDHSAVIEYASAVRSTASTFGIDHIPDGRQLIHTWCRERVRLGDDWPPTEFSAGITVMGDVPTLSTDLTELARARWDPMRESWSDARARLRKLVDDELERVAAGAEHAGLVFHDSRPNLLTRDITWLFWRLRFRLSYSAIAKRAHLGGADVSDRNPAERVRRAVERAALAMGIDQTG